MLLVRRQCYCTVHFRQAEMCRTAGVSTSAMCCVVDVKYTCKGISPKSKKFSAAECPRRKHNVAEQLESHWLWHTDSAVFLSLSFFLSFFFCKRMSILFSLSTTQYAPEMPHMVLCTYLHGHFRSWVRVNTSIDNKRPVLHNLFQRWLCGSYKLKSIIAMCILRDIMNLFK